MTSLFEYQKNSIWIKEYPVHYAGTDFNSRMTVIRLSHGDLMVHSPCKIDDVTKDAIEQLGNVKFIVAPGYYHYFFIASAQSAFPDAETFICPGIERKKPSIQFDWFLGNRPDERWKNDFDQVLIRGNNLIWEVAFFHKPTRTLLLVDLIENFTDQTKNVSLTLKLWWKLVFRMWDRPRPAPEYQLGWRDKQAASRSLKQILNWDFERIILAHGVLIEKDAKLVVRQAWQDLITLD